MTSASLTLTGPSAAECCAPSTGLDPRLDADRVAAVAKALGDPLRVQIVDVLQRSEAQVCQCELIALFAIHQSLLAYHMDKLVRAGLVQVQRRHKWAHYSVSTRCPEGADGMAEMTTEQTHAAACCDSAAQSSCCEPSAKEMCCGPAHEEGTCGCAAGQSTVDADIRETV